MTENRFSDRTEEVSITGTAYMHIKMLGRPQFDGLLCDDDTPPVARVVDGSLQIDAPSLEIAERWLLAWQQAVDHMRARAKSDALRGAQNTEATR